MSMFAVILWDFSIFSVLFYSEMLGSEAFNVVAYCFVCLDFGITVKNEKASSHKNKISSAFIRLLFFIDGILWFEYWRENLLSMIYVKAKIVQNLVLLAALLIQFCVSIEVWHSRDTFRAVVFGVILCFLVGEILIVFGYKMRKIMGMGKNLCFAMF